MHSDGQLHFKNQGYIQKILYAPDLIYRLKYVLCKMQDNSYMTFKDFYFALYTQYCFMYRVQCFGLDCTDLCHVLIFVHIFLEKNVDVPKMQHNT